MEDGAAGSMSVPEPPVTELPVPEPGPTRSATVELVVGGMHCQSCAELIEETLTGDPAVRHATVDLDAARASVTYDPATLTVDDLCAAVTGVGYRATRAAPAAPGS
ncbi:MAG TPA: heavy metal-associated domain-containing protein [Acidimicrobiales bacterium]|nr:heavy metal-associated domain-containing protein [Acidimicrobiales bacterium]HLN41089.1 heavy metal-associated domain-containing protein [Acidimicrobiales bacterium]